MRLRMDGLPWEYLLRVLGSVERSREALHEPAESGTYTRAEAALLLGVKLSLLRTLEDQAVVRPASGGPGSRYSRADRVALRYAIHLTQDKGMDWTTARILVNFQRTIRARGQKAGGEESP